MRHLALLGATLLALSACAENDGPLAPGDTPEGAASLATGALSGTILFTSFVNGKSDLFTIHPDGSGLTHLTQLPDDEQDAAWSWDNQWIVMMRRRPDASNAMHYEPYIVDKNGNGGHWLTSSPLGFGMRDPAC